MVNASPCISGRYPTLGPEILLNAGVPVIDAVGTDVFREVKDGTRVRLHEQLLYPADRRTRWPRAGRRPWRPSRPS